MHVLRDSPSIRGAVTRFPELSESLERRITELSEYEGYELHELVNLVVAEPGDTVEQLSAVLGIDVEHRQPDLAESHPGWYELTYVVSDDGFGFVVYIPSRRDLDARVLALCATHAADGPS